MFVGDLVRVSQIIEESTMRHERAGTRGIVTGIETAWPQDRYEETSTVTVQFEDGIEHDWYDWQLEILSSTAD